MLKDGTDSAFWHQFSRLPKWKQTFFLHEKMNLKIFFLQTLTLTAEKVTKWFDRNEDAVANVVNEDHNLFKTNNDEFQFDPKQETGRKIGERLMHKTAMHGTTYTLSGTFYSLGTKWK
jgi:hypothetical protein